MGLLFAESEKKVANTLTIVELMRKHDDEINELMERNQNLFKDSQKLKKAKYLINSRIGNLRASLKNKPNSEKEIELKIYFLIRSSPTNSIACWAFSALSK